MTLEVYALWTHRVPQLIGKIFDWRSFRRFVEPGEGLQQIHAWSMIIKQDQGILEVLP
jgi:hypothetical protein